MKFQISSKQLQRDLATVAKVILKKNSLAILDYALVSKREDKFYLTGASTDNQLTVAFDIRQTEGDNFTPFCIDANQFLSILGTLPEQPIEIIVDENTFATTVVYDGGDFQLPSMAALEFPVQATIDAVRTAFSIPAEVFLPSIKAAQSCTKVDELRPVMGAVALDVSNEGVTFVATTGAALFKYEYKHGVPFLSEGEPSMLLLHRQVVAAIETMAGRCEEVQIKADANRIEITAGDAVLVARSIEGRYPNYNAVIPQNSPYHVSLPVRDLSAAVRRVSLMSSVGTNMIELTKKMGDIYLLSTDFDFNRAAKVKLSSDDCTLPDGFRIGLKAETISLLIGNISTDNVRLCLSAADRAVVVLEDDPNSRLTEMCMPITLND